MRYVIWDFHGTLARNRRGMRSGTMLHLLQRARPNLRVTPQDLKPYLQFGFPWHTPERAHQDLETP